MIDQEKTFTNIGAVVIGRNEGQRLVNGLKSLLSQVDYIVYVDSGSTDGSIDAANELGIESVNLDLSIPFTAARARNAGAEYILSHHPELKYLQFIDGDCELQKGWITAAKVFLDGHPGYAAACGRRRERYPEHSIYNQLCDIEWDTPIGDALACGGDALYRVDAFQQVHGFNGKLIAGEEPDLCFRLRENGWKIRRIDHEMTLHDAAMTKFRQWWKRSVRAGFAYASGAFLHGNSKERYYIRECRRIYLWGIILPILIVTTSFFNDYFIAVLLVYPLQIIRLTYKAPQTIKVRGIWAASLVIGKFPEAMGLIKFWCDRLLGRQASIIEYK